MNPTYDDLYTAALGLTDEMRLSLIEALIPTIRNDADLDAEQIREVKRRADDVREGRTATIPGEEVFAEVEASLKAHRSAMLA